MSTTNNYFYSYLVSPIGLVEICANQVAIISIYFVEKQKQPANGNSICESAKQQLRDYFAGKLASFDLPLVAKGTQFQQDVWHALCQIPYGETCSYADIAQRLDNPKAVRAVGAANGKNPISIVVPCHRVIGASGKLTGYAGGLERKSWLLGLEQKQGSLM